MTKTEYMNTLRLELDGLPADVVEDTMWAYEGRFVDGLVAGRTESDIAGGLPAPHLVAAQKRASTRYQELKQKASPSNFASLFVALIGVAVFNPFMVIPAIFYSAVLFVSYLGSLALYGVGIAITAGALSGVPQMTFKIPTHQYHQLDDQMDEDFSALNGHVRVEISPTGINVNTEDGVVIPVAEHKAPASAPAVASAPSSSAAKGKTEQSYFDVQISNHLTRVDVFRGLGFLLGGIALFMLCLVMTKYTFIGFRKYLRWNVSLLRSPAAA